VEKPSILVIDIFKRFALGVIVCTHFLAICPANE